MTPWEEARALDALAAARVVLLGERHDRAEDHAWQARIVEAIAARAGPPLTVGFEMLPRRAQAALDAFGRGALDEPGFLAASDWARVWGFDFGLYRPLFALCRRENLPMLALNCDRPLVSLVGREGWGALPESERDWLSAAAPAPAGYRRYLFAVTGGRRPGRAAQAPDDPAFDRFVRAQGVWDRAFACAIAGALSARPHQRIAALIGRGHLEYGWGTPLQLADLGIASVATALPDGPADGLAEGRPPADFVWSRV